MSKNTLDFVKGMSFYTEQTDSQFFKDLKRVLRKLGISYIDKCCGDTFIGEAGAPDLDQQTLTINPNGTITISGGNTVDLCEAVKICETQTSLGDITFTNNILSIPYTGEDGITQIRTIDLSSLAVDVSINNITYDPNTNSWVVTETNGSTFNITWNDILADLDFCPAVKACETVTSIVNNNDGTFTYVDEAGEPTVITPIVTTTLPITGDGTLATPIALNANNDLGVQGGILQQGFPLVRDTKTNFSTFDREYFGDGIFRINNYPIGSNANTAKFIIENALTDANTSMYNLTSYKRYTHNTLTPEDTDNTYINTLYTGNSANNYSFFNKNLYTRYDINGIAPRTTIGIFNVVTQSTITPATFNILYGIYNRIYLLGANSASNVFAMENDNYFVNTVNGYSYSSILRESSSNVTNYYSYCDRTSDINSLLATNYWSLYMSTNRDNYIRGQVKIGSGANTASGTYSLEVGGNSLFNGDIDYTGALTFTSDKKLKNIGSDYTADINNFKQIKTYNYTWKDVPLNDALDKNEPQIGIIADEIEVLFPDFVSTKKRNVIVGYETVIEQEEVVEKEETRTVDVEKQKPIVEEQEVKSVNYSKLTIAMLSTIKQLIERVELLESNIVK